MGWGVSKWAQGITRGVALCLLAASASVGQAPVGKSAFRFPKTVPQPPDNRLNPARIKLGKMLFFDPRLSSSDWISCATCHNPALTWSDGLPTAIGHGMKKLPRATPSLVNTAFNSLQMWDGRFDSLEKQASAPMLSDDEMDGDLDTILARLRKIRGYRREFQEAYPGEGITGKTIAKAIASFERTLISRNSPFDAWIAGDESAIGPAAKRGFTLFVGKANCVACHQGPNFTDQGFHNIGLKNNTDIGRYAKVPIKAVRGAFKTPTLRDAALTAPYMHDGEYQTLLEVIDHYDRGGDDKQNLDPNIKPLHLSAREKADLIAFIKTLTGKPQPVTVPELPR